MTIHRHLKTFSARIVKTGLEERVAFNDYNNASSLPGPTEDAIEVFDPVNPNNNVTSRYSVGDRSALIHAAEGAADAVRKGLVCNYQGKGGKSLADHSWTVLPRGMPMTHIALEYLN